MLQAAGGAALKNPVGRNIMGDIRLRQGRPRDALREFDAAVRMASAFPEAHCNRGVALQELGRLADALAAEDRALALRPNYATAHFNRGNILRDLGRPDEAIAAYGRALKAQPAYPEALVNRGIALVNREQGGRGAQRFPPGAGAASGLCGRAYGRCQCPRQLNQVADALAEIDKVLAADPENRSALLAKAAISARAAVPRRRWRIVDGMVARDAADAVAHISRAHALAELRRFADALAAADGAVEQRAEECRGAPGARHGARPARPLRRSVGGARPAERLGASGTTLHHARAAAFANLGR